MRWLADWLDRLLVPLLGVLLALLTTVVLWQVAARFVLGTPSSFTEEVARFLLVWIGLLGGCVGYRRGAHPALELAARRLPPAAAARLERLVALLVALFAGVVLLGGGGRLAALTFALGQTAPASGIPMGWVHLALPTSGAVLACYALAQLAAPREAA